jgi:ring-1,2-phenylacetyl-CoA epoxidase subunit PaaE
MIPKFHQLTISHLERFGDFAVALGFAVPEELAESYRFLPGQYLTLRAAIDGEEVRRPYSICTTPHSGRLGVGIKHVEGGRFSTHALGNLAVGDSIDVMTPQGRFVHVDRNDDAAGDILLLAAGSGITPILSIAETALATGHPDTRVTLVYGNRNTASIMFRDRVEDLKDRYLDRCRVVHVLSREPRDAALLNGRLDAGKIASLVDAGLITPPHLSAAYLCGPDSMMTDCREALVAGGMNDGRIATEHFTPAPPPSGAKIPLVMAGRSQDDDTPDGNCQVELRADGITRRFAMDPSRQTILAAGQAAGMELPYSCEAGMCCTCRCRLVTGEVEMDANYSLEPWEMEAGFILSCQARPKTDSVTVDFDAV